MLIFQNKKLHTIISGLVYLLILVSFVNITNLPIPYKYNIEALVILGVFTIGAGILVKNYFSKRVMPRNILLNQYVFISLLLLLLSAVLANLNYGQPLTLGLLSSRRALYCLVGVIIFTLLQKNIITLKQLEQMFITSFIIMLALYYLTNILFPASTLSATADAEITKGFATYSDSRGIYRYRFDISLVVFGFIYSLVNKKNKLFLIYLLSSLLYVIFFHRGRIVISLFLFVSVSHLLLTSSLRTKVWFCIFSGIIISIVMLLNEVNQQALSHFLLFFKDGLSALMGEIGADASANSRIRQVEIAWKYITQFHYMGVGKISNKWYLTPELLFGYFHPSDIGLIGIWFLYGVAGIIAYVYLFLKTSKMFFTINKNNTFIFCCWIYSIYILLASLMTGAIFLSGFGQFSIMLAVLSFSLTTNKAQPMKWKKLL